MFANCNIFKLVVFAREIPLSLLGTRPYGTLGILHASARCRARTRLYYWHVLYVDEKPRCRMAREAEDMILFMGTFRYRPHSGNDFVRFPPRICIAVH